MGNPMTDLAIRHRRSVGRRPIVPVAAGALLAGATVWAASPAGAAAAIRVDCATADLQAAIDAAPAGSTVKVTGTCTGAFTIGKSLNLVGLGTAVLDGNYAGTPLTVTGGVTVALSNLVVQHTGRAGSVLRTGLRNGGNVTLRRVTVTDNFAGLDGSAGITNDGTMVLYDSTVTGNTAEYGGGIGNNGRLTLKHSSVTGNGGGGIYNTGTLTVSDSTIHGNGGHLHAGGLYNTATGTATLTRSPVTDNSDGLQGTGGIYNGGRLTLRASPVTGNSGDEGVGGITNAGTATLNRSPVSGNASLFPGTNTGTGGIYNTGTITLHRSPVTDNVPNNCSPPGSVASCSG